MSFGRFDRMVAIPEDEYKQMRNMQQLTSPEAAHFQNLSRKHDQQDAIRDPYDRIHLQGETLNQMIALKDTMRQRLLEATPKPYQNRASTLFSFMKDKLQISPKGEIYGNDGQLIAGSNITDLVQHAVRDRRRAMNPSGWLEFVNYMKQNNVPNMILNYDTLDEMRLPKAIPKPKERGRPRERGRKQMNKAMDEMAKERKVLKRSLRNRKMPAYLKDFDVY